MGGEDAKMKDENCSELENKTSKPAYYSLNQLMGIFNQPEDEGHFVLDIQVARDEILNS